MGRPLRRARAEPSAKVRFPYSCALAHRTWSVALPQELAAEAGSGEREGGRSTGGNLIPSTAL
jgi:hypothetical protein